MKGYAMQTLVHYISALNDTINRFVWGVPMLVFFLAVGVLYTIGTRCFQFRHFKLWFSETILTCFKKSPPPKPPGPGLQAGKKKHTISPWQAMATALASTGGVGNIAGVATAITAGGPGALFWMWVSALLGMMTHYGETVLGICFRNKDKDGHYSGGPMIYMEKGLHCKWLACFFSLFCIGAALGMGNMSQSNSMADALNHSWGTPKLVIGIAAALITGLVITGGIGRITVVSEKLVPIMSILYIIGALLVVMTHLGNVPAAFRSIFHEAFNFRAAGGGILGYGIAAAMRTGISRGVFSNEAGLGSSVMVHAAADVDHPAIQGMWGIFEVFADTMVVCTITGLAILCSNVYDQTAYLNAMQLDQMYQTTRYMDALPNGVPLASAAFASTFGSLGDIFVSFSILLFGLATLLSWSYFGEQAVIYLFGRKIVPAYKFVYIFFIVIGAVARLDFVWSVSDTLNGLMAIPNLIAITVLSPTVFRVTKDYFVKYRGGGG